MGGIEALSGLSGLRTRVIILAAVISEGDVLKAIQSGARGVMLKDAATRELLDGIHRVINGSHVVGDDTLDSLADAVCRPSGPLRDRRFRLTTRELDIVSAMMARRSNGEIADHLSISVQTVKHHLTTIFDKTRVSSRLELAQFAAAQRLVNDGRFA
jgi:DNA-binding NarL/FixJ family response regulator